MAEQQQARALLLLTPESNLGPVQKEERLTRTLERLAGMDTLLMDRARGRAAALLDAGRVKRPIADQSARQTG